ncbi:hypothetical protein [Cerasicoccus maritimus]|uniref:hypothetical protein n=1 Tax=Cerasicoccus maritimus TaxID=490089 RepID=UPI0028527948|nr:hypothetical protein [Cerasicoccus maritimus]
MKFEVGIVRTKYEDPESDFMTSVTFANSGFEKYLTISRPGRKYFEATSEFDGGLADIECELNNQVNLSQGGIKLCSLSDHEFRIQFSAEEAMSIGDSEVIVEFPHGGIELRDVAVAVENIFRDTDVFRHLDKSDI